MRHELRLIRVGLRALAMVFVPMLAVGAATAGRSGAASVAAGTGILAANQALAAASTGWSRRLGYATLVTGYAGFVVRMVGVLTAFSIAAQVPAIHKTLFVAAFCGSLALVLGVECWSYAKKTYVPEWRIAR